jgi:hypothetical protein
LKKKLKKLLLLVILLSLTSCSIKNNINNDIELYYYGKIIQINEENYYVELKETDNLKESRIIELKKTIGKKYKEGLFIKIKVNEKDKVLEELFVFDIM